MSQSREIVLDRREKIKELYFIKRYSIKTISKQLDWSIPTIWQDIQHLKHEFVKEISQVDLKEYLAEILIRNQEIMSKAWEEYYNAKYTRDRLDALRLIQETDKNYLDELERFGIIQRLPIRNVNVNVDATDDFTKMMERWRAERNNIIKEEN